MTIKLRPYQRESVDSLYSYFEHSDGNPLVVLPTGAGKTLVIAAFCREVLEQWPTQRILILTHVRELVQQDFDKIKQYWHNAPAGIYSASLGMRQPRHGIVVATVQSVYKKAHILGHRDMVLIDEAHLLSNKDTGMYRRLLLELWKINSRIKIIGLTATPYRLDSGMLHEGEGALFSDIAYELPVSRLIAERYLTPLISKSSKLQANLSKVDIMAGEFNSAQMERAFDIATFTMEVLDEVLALASDRRSILFFCTGVGHAEHVRDALKARGILAEAVSGETPAGERDRILRDFKAGRIRVLTSVNVVAVGFDAPNVDCIVLLRATMSPGLFVQMLGRGLRLAEGKNNCLVLDHGGNLARHGPLTHIIPPEKKRKGQRKKKEEEEKPVVRICDNCRSTWPMEYTECLDCGAKLVAERDPLAKLETKASDVPVMMSNDEWLERNTEWVDVDMVSYHRHKKEGKPDSLRVEYHCGMMKHSEWVCLEHPGFAGKKATKWWSERGGLIPVPPVSAALQVCGTLRTPKRIRVQRNGKYFEVIDYELNASQQSQLAIGA